MNSPFSNPSQRRLISDYNVAVEDGVRREEQQRILTLREYQLLRATRSQSHTTQQQQVAEGVTRNASAPCLSSRSSSSSSNLSSASSSTSSSSRHLSPRPRTHRYTSPCVHPQFQCGNCNSKCNIVPYNNNNTANGTPMSGAISGTVSTLSLSSSASAYSSDSSSLDQSFCNRDCYYSYCFRLAEELDCTADDIIEANYHSVNGYISQSQGHTTSTDGIISTDQQVISPSDYNTQHQPQPQTRCLISRVH